MMLVSELGLRTTNFTIAQACVEWIAPSTTRPRIMEVSFTTATATAQSIGLGRPQAKGVTPVPVLFQAADHGAAASASAGSLSWGTSPTVPLVFMRRWNGAATVGVGFIWTFPEGLSIPSSGSVVLWNITTSVAADVNCTIIE